MDLISKIEELLKGLFALKEQQGPLVPTLKATKVTAPAATPTKTLPTLPTLPGFKVAKPPAPTPIPGNTAPSSKKNPAKVAEQLRNPKPQKPNTEVLKVESNGQWSLK